MNRLRELREDRELLQIDLGRLLNIGTTTYASYENEIADIPNDVLCLLANLYNVSTDYILCNTNSLDKHSLIKRKKSSNLKLLRTSHNYTQEYIAQYLNISQNGYRQYELPNKQIPSQTLIKLSKLFNTSIDYILCRTDDPLPYPDISCTDIKVKRCFMLDKDLNDRLVEKVKNENIDIDLLVSELLEEYLRDY